MPHADNDNVSSFRAAATPTEHRATVAAWAATAPDNDSEVLPRRVRPSRPRHREMEDELRPLLVWRNLNILAETDLVGSNFLGDIAEEASNDNIGSGSAESGLDVAPTVDDLMDAIADVESHWMPDHAAGRFIVTGGDIERDAEGRLVRIGRLQLSEKHDGRIIGFRPAWYVGEHWYRPAETLTPRRRSKTPAPPLSRPVDPRTVDEARRTTGHIRSRLAPVHVHVLDLAISASNFAEVGTSLGKHGKAAERTGKLAVIEACAAMVALASETAVAA